MGHDPDEEAEKAGLGAAMWPTSRRSKGGRWALGVAINGSGRCCELSSRSFVSDERKQGAAAGEAGDAGGMRRQQASQAVRDEAPAYRSGGTSAQVAACGRFRG